MRTMTLTVDGDWKTALRQAGEQFQQAWKTGEYRGESIGFTTPALLFDSLTPSRWKILDVMQETKLPMSLQELVGKTGQSFENIGMDVDALLDLGLLERLEDGKFFCPFDEIRAEFTLLRVA
ncbi:MAG: transcriptional regulator [Proteobacteria bacterium]|nr:transcriptional regulator [Pseudomonadota bacterium]